MIETRDDTSLDCGNQSHQSKIPLLHCRLCDCHIEPGERFWLECSRQTLCHQFCSDCIKAVVKILSLVGVDFVVANDSMDADRYLSRDEIKEMINDPPKGEECQTCLKI